jgi:hypothetical protein
MAGPREGAAIARGRGELFLAYNNQTLIYIFDQKSH